MTPRPSPAWYASGLRWIASGLVKVADALDHRAPEPWPLLSPAHGARVEDALCEARHRAQRPL